MGLELSSDVVRTGFYGRISDDALKLELGVKRQSEDCYSSAEKRGWAITRDFIDNDISASKYSNKPRPQFDALLRAITDREIDAVIAWDVDRLIRRPLELEVFFNTCDKAGLTRMATPFGKYRLDDPNDQFLLRILGATAAKESDTTSRRIKRQHQQRRDAGVMASGPRTFGWRDLEHVDPDEAPIVAELVTRALAGESYRALCRDLNARGVLTTRGNLWRTSTLRKLLTNPRHAGLVSHRGKVTALGTFGQIITADDHHRIVARVQHRAGPRPRVHPLTGLLECGKCGVKLVGHTKSYFCLSGCNGTMIGKHLVEPAVVAMLAEAIDMGVFNAARTPDLAPLYVDLDQRESKLVELSGLWADETITREEWLAAREPVMAGLEDVRKRIAQAEMQAPDVDAREVVEKWPKLDVEQQARHLRAFFEKIVVGPGRPSRFDPGRLKPVWRV